MRRFFLNLQLLKFSFNGIHLGAMLWVKNFSTLNLNGLLAERGNPLVLLKLLTRNKFFLQIPNAKKCDRVLHKATRLFNGRLVTLKQWT